uniref:Endonuclease-reverse transcriptase n=1 Tax=Rhodnius prolixus TaxID=13249 RepID=T1HB53_RHOPR
MGDKEPNLNDLMVLINQLRTELSQKNDDLIEKVKSTDKKINLLLQKSREQSDKITELEGRIKQSEDAYKRKNLLLFNFPEKDNEKIYDLEKEIESIFRDVLKTEVNLKDIDAIRRVGINKRNNRPVLIRFLALRCKYEVLRSAKNLKGTSLVLTEDFPLSVRETRKKLYPFWKEARSENKKAFMYYDKLKIDGRFWSLDQLQKKGDASSLSPSESEREDDSVSTGLDNVSDGTLRNWIREGRLMRRKKPQKRKADDPHIQQPFRKPQAIERKSSKESGREK